MNVLKEQRRILVQALLRDGLSQREISRLTGVDRKTIRKLSANTPTPVICSDESAQTPPYELEQELATSPTELAGSTGNIDQNPRHWRIPLTKSSGEFAVSRRPGPLTAGHIKLLKMLAKVAVQQHLAGPKKKKSGSPRQKSGCNLKKIKRKTK